MQLAALIPLLRASHDTAVRNAGLTSTSIAIAGRAVRMAFAGNDLHSVLMPSLHGLLTTCSAAEPFLIRAWTGAHVPFPCTELQASLARFPDKVTVINDGAVHLQYNPAGEILSCIDTDSGEAYYYTSDPARLPDYEVCTPMRMLINWYCLHFDALMVHAAAVGVNGRGVLIIGRSGAGKSTTGLQCLLHGLDYLGDDYVALSGNQPTTVHHLFRGCKVMDDALDRLPALRPHVLMHHGASGKNVIIANDMLGKLVASLELVAIVRPRICHAPESTFATLPAMRAVAEFAGSTILQMPGTGPRMLKALASLCSTTPAFEMSLSTEPGEIAAALRRFILQQPRLSTTAA